MLVATYQYRLEPDDSQRHRLEQTLEVCRRLYNNALAQRREAWKHERRSLSYAEQCRLLPQHKPNAEPIQQVHAQVLQQTLKRLQRAFDNFFRRCKVGAKQKGYPRFKSPNRFHSFVFPQWGNGVKIIKERLFLSKIGEIKVRWHRPLEGQPRQCRIKREGPHWYACILCQVEPAPLPQTGQSVGIDLGLTDFATFSDEREPIDNPRFLRKAEQKLIQAQQRVSRRQRNRGKGQQSRRYHKAKQELAKIHRKVANCRKDFAHKEARKLVNAYDHIGVEDLHISNMLKNHHIAKSIADAGWGFFVRLLIEKAERATNKVVQLVDPRHTTQACSGCDMIVRKQLWERWHSCAYCGLEIHRDSNAARNVYQRAQKVPERSHLVGTPSGGRCVPVIAGTESLFTEKQARRL